MKTAAKVTLAVAAVAVLVVGIRRFGPWGHDRPRAPVVRADAGGPRPIVPAPAAATAAVGAGDRAPVAQDDDPRGGLRLEGVVVDLAEHGVARARVAIDASPPIVIETDSDGSFTFEGLIARDYRVEATAGDRYAGPVRLRLTDAPEPVTLRLRPAGVLEVAVTDRASGAPVAGAAVELRDALAWQGVTGADGVATLRGVGATWAPVVVTATGYAPAAAMVSTSGDPAAPVRAAIAIGRGAAVSGRVIDLAGAPIAGARVTAASASDPFPVIDPRRDGVTTGADGRFALPAVAAGTWRLTASDADHGAATSSPFVVDGVAPRGGFELVLTAGAVLDGVVTDGGGRPVAAATVRVVTRGHVSWRPRRQTFTDDAGRFSMRGLPRRAVEVVAWHAGGASAIVPADLAAAPRQEVALVLDVTGAISGTVADPAGVPVIDAQVIAEPQWSGGVADRAAWQVRGVQQVVTDAGGGFRFAGLPAGSYRVRAARPGAPEQAAWQGAGVMAKPGDPPLQLVLAADGRVIGKVAFADGHAPALFSIEWNDAYPLPFAAKDGGFGFDAPPGPLALTISGPGFVPKRTSATVEAGKPTDLGTITVEAGRSVSGRVLDGGGAPVPGAKVAAGVLLSGGGSELYIEDESIGARSTETGDDGRFTLSGFPPRPLTVVAGKDGVGRAASVQLPRSPDSAVVELVLQAVGGVDGKITRGGQPLADTVVIANPVGATASNFFVVTGPDGTFAFDALTPGAYFLYPMIGGGGGRPKDMVLRTVEVVAGGRASLTIDATPGPGKLTIAVTTDAGAPAAMAMLMVIQAAVDVPNMEALRDGTFLPPTMRDGATMMMHMRTAMGGAVELEGVRPGAYTACAVVLPIGDDPARAREFAEQMELLPMKCAPATVAAAPARVEITVPVAWTRPPA